MASGLRRILSAAGSPRGGRVALLLLLSALVLLPAAVGRYTLYLGIQILILAVFAVGFNLLFGYAGLLSFGQAGFFAVGAYACAKVLLVVPNLLAGILAGLAAAGVVALALGALSVRHTRIYFSMLTLAWGMLIFSAAWKWRDFTGGDDGLVGIPRAPLTVPGVGSLRLDTTARYYYLVLVVAVAAIWLMRRIVTSPLGLTLQAIRDSETRAAFAGVPVAAYRLAAFTVAGVYAGLAGSLLPALESTVTPPIAHWSFSAEPLMATLLGGIHVFAGPIVGAVLMYLMKDLVVRVTAHWLIWLGLIVVALVMGFRGGVASILVGWLRPRGAAPAPGR